MVNKHFFQPLLQGFHSHLTIPTVFLLKNIEGRFEKNTVKLRSDASNISWEVKLDGQKLCDGWEEFALAHDLRIGDIVVFRQEKDMVFHVTILGPSCCEIQYESCLNDQKKPEKIERKQNKKKKAESSSLDPSCLMANVTPSNLKEDRMFQRPVPGHRGDKRSSFPHKLTLDKSSRGSGGDEFPPLSLAAHLRSIAAMVRKIQLSLKGGESPPPSLAADLRSLAALIRKMQLHLRQGESPPPSLAADLRSLAAMVRKMQLRLKRGEYNAQQASSYYI